MSFELAGLLRVQAEAVEHRLGLERNTLLISTSGSNRDIPLPLQIGDTPWPQLDVSERYPGVIVIKSHVAGAGIGQEPGSGQTEGSIGVQAGETAE